MNTELADRIRKMQRDAMHDAIMKEVSLLVAGGECPESNLNVDDDHDCCEDDCCHSEPSEIDEHSDIEMEEGATPEGELGKDGAQRAPHRGPSRSHGGVQRRLVRKRG